jgi:hypothetical protein
LAKSCHFCNAKPPEIDAKAVATLPEAFRIAEEMILQERHSPTWTDFTLG